MDKKTIQSQIDELDIVSIEVAGELSSGIVESAIASTKNLMSVLDLDKISNEMDEQEKIYN